MAASRRASRPKPALERRLTRVARRVLAWEGAHDATVELNLLDAAAMRRLNRRATGRRALTDVIAYGLPQPDGRMVGDVFICPAAARAWAAGEPGGARRLAEELTRLAVHGTLHVLGYDHPEGTGRTRSAMWRRQECYVARLANGRRRA